MQRMFHPFGQPIAYDLDLSGIPKLKKFQLYYSLFSPHFRVFGDETYFEKIQNPKLIVHFASNLIHRISSKINIRLSHFFARSGNILQTLSYNLLFVFVEILPRELTVKLRIDPIKLPSSYLANLESVASNTDTNLLIIPCDMVANVFSIMSSVLEWYWY